MPTNGGAQDDAGGMASANGGSQSFYLNTFASLQKTLRSRLPAQNRPLARNDIAHPKIWWRIVIETKTNVEIDLFSFGDAIASAGVASGAQSCSIFDVTRPPPRRAAQACLLPAPFEPGQALQPGPRGSRCNVVGTVALP
jgi:hypothetical protein